MKSYRSSPALLRSRPQLEELEGRYVLSSGLPPTAAEQLLLEQLNDIRANPAAYGSSIGVDLSNVPAVQPLAIDPLLTQAAHLHAQDMNTRGYFSQNTPEGLDPGQRLTQAGFQPVSWGESSAGGSAYPDSASALQSLIVDQGDAGLSHRTQLLALNAVFQTQAEVGIGIVQGGTGPLVNYYTIDTAAITDPRPFLTGVIFKDTNGNGKYDLGEGLGDVVLTVTGEGVTKTTATYDSGGYSLQLGPGTYTVTASGGGLIVPVTQTVTLTTQNVRLNFVLSPSAVQPQAAAWVGLLYRDVLGRVPSPSEVSSWTGSLASSGSRPAVVDGFLNSTEFALRTVTHWYEQYLHRQPDQGGLSSFSSAFAGGTHEDAIRVAILASPEYLAIHGNTPAGFVKAIYEDLLDRDPAGHEADGWVSQAAAGNERAVATGILGSQEFKTIEVGGFYDTLLRRHPDKGGLSTFVNLLLSGSDERDVMRGILSSSEYYSSAHNILWLQGLYRDVLGRTGDSVNELGSWLATLNSGVSKAALAQAFVSMPEADGRTVTVIYHQLLGRDPDNFGLSAFVHQLQSDGHVAGIIDAIAASPEYDARQGGTPTNFVRGLYHDLLNRGASETEVTIWLNKLNGGETRQQVAADFTAASAYQTYYITSLYMLYLRRSPTLIELNQSLSQLQSGAIDAAVSGSILGSDAYFALNGS